jgi:hypothetical protein
MTSGCASNCVLESRRSTKSRSEDAAHRLQMTFWQTLQEASELKGPLVWVAPVFVITCLRWRLAFASLLLRAEKR